MILTQIKSESRPRQQNISLVFFCWREFLYPQHHWFGLRFVHLEVEPDTKVPETRLLNADWSLLPLSFSKKKRAKLFVDEALILILLTAKSWTSQTLHPSLQSTRPASFLLQSVLHYSDYSPNHKIHFNTHQITALKHFPRQEKNANITSNHNQSLWLPPSSQWSK